MKNNDKLKKVIIISYILVSILSFVIILVIPSTRVWFGETSSKYAYLMGFIKFALLATAGELIASYIISVNKTVPCKIVWRFIIWGLIGVWITFMMKVYSNAVITMMSNGLLVGGNSNFLRALFTSVLMNTTFGPTFMAVHKCTDKMLELKAKGEKATLNAVVKGIDWGTFASFTILKTVPLFWIPAHTITFLLPSQYQVIMAASLSIALGIILSFGNRKKTKEQIQK